MGPGPFSRLAPDAAKKLLDLSELVAVTPERLLVRQYHHADYFYLLLHGEVEFRLEVGGQMLGVGGSDRPWTPVGWSGFRAPFRYATCVRAVRHSELLRFPLERLAPLFATQPEVASDFFQAVSESATGLLVDLRERLIGSLRSETSLSSWTDGSGPTSGRSRQRAPAPAQPPETLGFVQLPASEAMVRNAAPDARALLRKSPFFQDFPDQAVEILARETEATYFCRGDAVCEQGSLAEELVILGEGRVRLEYRGATGTTAALMSLSRPGQVLSFCLLDAPRRQITTVRALWDGALIRIKSEALRRIFAVYPHWGRLYGQQCLWLISRHLEGARAHLLSEAFDREMLAVENVVEQSRTQLSVASPLHKLPHLLGCAVTLGDALGVVDAARSSSDPVESHVAELCHELLSPVRREQRFFSSLQAAFQQVVTAPSDCSPERLRRENAETFVRMFSQIPSRIEGLSHLPAQPGNVFIFNHLRNHEYNTLPNGFQLTLDCHFISSMILHRHYGDPGVRVVRSSRAGEYGHQDYYSRLGHVAVYTTESDRPQVEKSERVKLFIETARRHLCSGTNLVLAPEGTSYGSEDSPGPFKAGAFRLAASLEPEPLIVPIAMANFDRRLDRAVLGVVIDRPWRISERLADPDDPVRMRRFLDEYRKEYRALVERARSLTEPSRQSQADGAKAKAAEPAALGRNR